MMIQKMIMMKYFSNKSLTSFENKSALIYIPNVSKMLWRDTSSISSSNSIMILCIVVVYSELILFTYDYGCDLQFLAQLYKILS